MEELLEPDKLVCTPVLLFTIQALLNQPFLSSEPSCSPLQNKTIICKGHHAEPLNGDD